MTHRFSGIVAAAVLAALGACKSEPVEIPEKETAAVYLDRLEQRWPSIVVPPQEDGVFMPSREGGYESGGLRSAKSAPQTVPTGEGAGSLTEQAMRLFMPRSKLGVFAASNADKGISLSVGDSPAIRALIKPVGGRGAAAEAVGTRVLYRRVWPSADLIYEAAAKKMKEMIVLRDAKAPRRFVFRVEPGSGISAWRLVDRGVQMLDQEGRPRFGLPPPFLLDASGNRRDLAWEREGDDVVLRIPDGVSYPALVDPTVDLLDAPSEPARSR